MKVLLLLLKLVDHGGKLLEKGFCGVFTLLDLMDVLFQDVVIFGVEFGNLDGRLGGDGRIGPGR
jgi:hypothetical protein